MSHCWKHLLWVRISLVIALLTLTGCAKFKPDPLFTEVTPGAESVRVTTNPEATKGAKLINSGGVTADTMEEAFIAAKNLTHRYGGNLAFVSFQQHDFRNYRGQVLYSGYDATIEVYEAAEPTAATQEARKDARP